MSISTRLNFIVLILMVLIGILSLTDRNVDSSMYKTNKAVKAIPERIVTDKAVKAIPECLVTDEGIVATHGAICPEFVH